MKKIYMAGAGGMLGDAFYKQFRNDYQLYCTDKDVNATWLSFCDFRDLEEYKRQVLSFAPDYLFHLGAHTDLEYCERNVDDTYLTNTIAVENAVYLANELDIPLLYISTAGIFDGAKDVYDDWDTPNPLGVYARSKYLAEVFVQQNAKRYLICRAGWMMGGGPAKDKKFINKVFKKISAGEKLLYVVNDKLGVPTYTHDFSKNVRLLVEQELWGLYNMVCGGVTGRFEVANELIKILKLDLQVKVQEVDSTFFSKEYFAPRPNSERLVNYKMSLRNLNIMRDWKVALREYIQNDFS